MLKKILKSALILGVVGLVLGMAVPVIMPFFVTHGLLTQAFADSVLVSNSILWEGVFFGAFGAVNAAVDPIINGVLSLFGSHDKTPESTIKQTSKAAPAVIISHAGHPDLAPEQDQPPQPTTKFQDRVGGPRASDLSFEEKIAASRVASGEQRTIH